MQVTSCTRDNPFQGEDLKIMGKQCGVKAELEERGEGPGKDGKDGEPNAETGKDWMWSLGMLRHGCRCSMSQYSFNLQC